MKTILQKSFVFTVLSFPRMQIHHSFLAILLMLFVFLPATGKAGTGSGSGLSSLGYDCSSGRCICSGGRDSVDCMALQADKCPGKLLGCNVRGKCACAGSATARQATPAAPVIKGTVPTAPQQGTTALTPVVPRADLSTTTVAPKSMTSVLHDTRKAVIQNLRMLWLTPSKPSYRTARLVTRPGVIGASMEVTCEGGKTFTISSGNNTGACGATIGVNGNVSGGMCGSASGESGGGSASVSCSANNGQGACTGSSGGGSCGETRP